jgi:phosphoribosyl 1,2-cyclic phosphodiesterase
MSGARGPAGARVRVLRSGSAGNAVFLEAAGARLLIDAGVPLEVVAAELAALDLTLKDLTALLLTHEHDDHARTAGALARAAGVHVFANAATLRAAAGFLGAAPAEPFTTGRPFAVGACRIDPFPIPHDAAEPVGFAIRADGLQVVVAYDLGDADGALRERLPQADLVLLEANYDPRLLGVSGYPWFLKNRILSPMGHLSNEGAARAAVWAARGGRVQAVFLLHLSEVNNIPPLARDVVRWALEREGIRTVQVEAVRPNTAGPLWAAAPPDAAVS